MNIRETAIAAAKASLVNPLVLGLVAVVVILSIKDCSKPSSPLIPAVTQNTIDSLSKTRSVFNQQHDSTIKIIVKDTIAAVVAQREANAAKTQAGHYAATADSLAKAARISADSAHLWHLAFDSRTQEADSLRSAFVAESTSYVRERDARIKYMGLFLADSVRLDKTEQVSISLQKALSHAETKCTVAKVLKCPSRTETAILTVVSVLAVQHAVSH